MEKVTLGRQTNSILSLAVFSVSAALLGREHSVTVRLPTASMCACYCYALNVNNKHLAKLSETFMIAQDFANTIPGHGGIMDRFDCQYLMATFVNVYIASFIRYRLLLHDRTQRLQLRSGALLC